ncbi:hypothetical protein AHOG_26720 [Actinoalloteichus hoggarensis]|uniref:Uncharacterized protein n=1 Tax=Actinoalloteichus hoggarensis TaxID=1470176 RepID=A0A221WBA4_9PSEU|nr:hypothetical protein AHOG_26720 [Actinoalloteichus hoggarensis]
MDGYWTGSASATWLEPAAARPVGLAAAVESLLSALSVPTARTDHDAFCFGSARGGERAVSRRDARRDQTRRLPQKTANQTQPMMIMTRWMRPVRGASFSQAWPKEKKSTTSAAVVAPE